MHPKVVWRLVWSIYRKQSRYKVGPFEHVQRGFVISRDGEGNTHVRVQ